MQEDEKRFAALVYWLRDFQGDVRTGNSSHISYLAVIKR